MILLSMLACLGEKNTESEEEFEVINDQRIIQSDYDYLVDGVQYQGLQLYVYETDDTRFYTEREWTETIGEETALRLQTTTLDSAGRWEQFTSTVDGEPYYIAENYEYDEYSNITYREVTGAIEGFEDEEDVTYAEYETTYKSSDTLLERNDRFYREDGTPRETQTQSYFMSQFEPCPHSPNFYTNTIERFDAQGERSHDQIYTFDENGYPVSVSSSTAGWSYRFAFEFDEGGKPSSYTFVDEETDIPYSKYELSYASGKLSGYTYTDYDEAGEIEEQYRIEIAFTPAPIDNPRTNGLCFSSQMDMDGNLLRDHWHLDSWNNVSRSYTRISPEGESGYYLQELETYSFEVTE